MAPTSIDDVFENDGGSGSPDRKPFQDILTKITFIGQLAALAKAAEIGNYAYSVSFGRFKGGKDLTEKCHYLILVRCKQTPKIKAVPNWKALDQCRWVYSVTSPVKASVEVLFQPRDTIQLQAAVGSCYLAKAGAQKRVLTLGLIVDEFENQTFKNYWAVGVSHGFINPDDPNAGKEALICPFTGTVDCESCISDHCLPQCAANSLQTLKVAEGNEIKVSTVVGNPDEVFASDFAAFIMNKPLNALNIKGIKQIVENAPIDKIDPELLQKAQTQFAGFNGASGGICPVAKLEKLMNPNPLNTKPVVFVFKKGLNTNWTWGVLDDVDEVYREFLIRDPWKAGTVNQPLFCDGGDCGSIVFVLDENKRASPIGYLHSSSKLPGENTVYHLATSFERVLKDELAPTTGIEKANWKINLDQSFKYI